MTTTERKGIFGIGLFWSRWRGELIPDRYRADPREYDRAQMDLVRDAGGSCIQIGLDWDKIEPQPGTFYWEDIDAGVQDAGDRGLELYACIGNTPPWAVPEPEPGKEKLPGYRTPPDERHAASFSEYCRAAAERYRGRISHFTFWNEPNGCGWINAGCANSGGYPLYTHWLKKAYRALKEGNPEATVAAGALDYHSGVPEGWKYIQGIYEEGGKEFFDALEIHPYAPQGIHWQAVRDTRRVMLANGDDHKPIWIGEYGWQDAGSERAARDLEEFLNLVRREEFDFISHARYLVVSDLNEGLYGLTDIELNRRLIYHVFKRTPKTMLEKGATPAIPRSALPCEPMPSSEAGRKPEQTKRGGSSGLQIHCSKKKAEYNEEIVLALRLPSARERPKTIRWRVDGELQEGAGGLRYCFCRRPEKETVYSISAEVRCGARTRRAVCRVTVRPFLSNRFTVLIDDPPQVVEADRTIRLLTRVLNNSSHDLTFLWKIDGDLVHGAERDYLEIKGGSLACGPHTIEVTCLNAGRRASDARRIEFRESRA